MSEINVVQRTQRIVVDPFSSAVAIINAGPQGPKGADGGIGPPGPGTPSEYLRADGTVPATGALVVPNAALDTHALNRITADGRYLTPAGGDARYLAIATKYAKGQVAYAQIVANVTLNTSALTDIAGLSLTYTCEANRRYRARAKLHGQSTVVNDLSRYSLLADAAIVDSENSVCVVINQIMGAVIVEKVYNTGISAGSHTFKIQAYRLAGTGAPVCVASATVPSFIELEDIGPV